VSGFVFIGFFFITHNKKQRHFKHEPLGLLGGTLRFAVPPPPPEKRRESVRKPAAFASVRITFEVSAEMNDDDNDNEDDDEMDESPYVDLLNGDVVNEVVFLV
jgi:hypothetical protein